MCNQIIYTLSDRSLAISAFSPRSATFYYWRELPQLRFLSRQTQSFFRQTHVLPRQTHDCCNKHVCIAWQFCCCCFFCFFCRDKIVVVSALANDSVHLSMLAVSCSACDSRRGNAIPLGYEARTCSITLFFVQYHKNYIAMSEYPRSVNLFLNIILGSRFWG